MNYTFTFITEQEYWNARSTGYIKEYDLMRIEIHDDNGMMIGDYPVNTMEEFVRDIKHLNQKNTKFSVYSDKSYFDIEEYNEEDDLKDWDVTIGDGLEYL